MNYRREIDGLRAFAVLPVILFHAGFEMFSGGFIGVDIFFVISGYLITTIVLTELVQEKFSLAGFYERRARRILPMLFLVMLVCIPFAWLWMLPSDTEDFSQSLVAVSIFSSNILFWEESGYFDATAELKPLLHTWSLAVEEQYYVIFPFFLMLSWRFGKQWILTCLAIVFAMSLVVAEWGSHTKPTAAFYLLPTRAWELLTGAFAAFYLLKTRCTTFKKSLSEPGGWAGIALILYAVFAYDPSTPFPGFHAIIPTVGALLVILFATHLTTAGKFIGNKIFVGIGLISYSAYLWHQPLFAFARHRSPIEPGHDIFVVLSIVNFILAYLSWRYIERPFRVDTNISTAQIFSLAFLTSLAFISIGVLESIYHEKIVLYRHADDVNFHRNTNLLKLAKSTSPVALTINRHDDGNCRFSVLNLDATVSERLTNCAERFGAGVLVFGDSHATNLYHALIRNPANANISFMVGITKNGCHLPTQEADCQYEEILEFLKKHPSTFKHAIYEKAGHLMLKFSGRREELRNPRSSIKAEIDINTINGVGNYLEKLSKYSSVTWFGPRLEPLVSEREYLKLGCNTHFAPTEKQVTTYNQLDTDLEKFSDNKNWRYVSQIKLVNFDFSTDFGDCNRLLWLDMNHFSKEGEELFGKRFVLSELLR